jgi:hypothetical protein
MTAPRTLRLEGLLQSVFEAEGCVNAALLARRAAEDLELDERDELIYQLRATLTETQLAHRFQLTSRRVQQIVRARVEIHRSQKYRNDNFVF